MEAPKLDYIKQISGGDEGFEKSLLTILKIEFPAECALLQENFNTKKFNLVALDVHKIKHKIAMLGMTKSVELATKFEDNIRNGVTEQYDDLMLVLKRINVYLEKK